MVGALYIIFVLGVGFLCGWMCARPDNDEKKTDAYIREQVERLFEEYYFNARDIYYNPNSDERGIYVRIEGMKFIPKEKNELQQNAGESPA